MEDHVTRSIGLGIQCNSRQEAVISFCSRTVHDLDWKRDPGSINYFMLVPVSTYLPSNGCLLLGVSLLACSFLLQIKISRRFIGDTKQKSLMVVDGVDFRIREIRKYGFNPRIHSQKFK
jgi:hypothetical protein